ncbi:hypothetical protein AXF42_Ash005916 [Apostasia shenzhenica]|uniref:Isopentenyl phosphate kinase n=1 Tax=Apostasia shenzhenica TaxID=1088818 RepID=A0A2I0BCR1_9ASPA|nr:hypothetical protein AXF42_Ash005916 [Apostasia shenzhenica]
MEIRSENPSPVRDSSPDETLTQHKPLRCIVKLGGAAITCKNELERINEESLVAVCHQLRESMAPAKAAGGAAKILGMDWSRRPDSHIVSVSDEFDGRPLLDVDGSFIIVHGAGSFGHFQASRSRVHKGGLHLPLVQAGFVATRISIASADVSQIVSALGAGFVPVLHGDAVLDHSQDCTILSGDVIIRHLAKLLRPQYVVFLTDVLGVYDRPPADRNAILVREIVVDEEGNWSIVRPPPEHLTRQAEVEISVASHDTTGGMETKIAEAVAIAKLGIDVYITMAGTEHSLSALRGVITTDWLGTVIRSTLKINMV